MSRFEGKRILITGGTNGMGLAGTKLSGSAIVVSDFVRNCNVDINL